MDLDYLQALMGEEAGAEELDEYRHVWVVAEAQKGALAPISLELLGKARQLADMLGVYLEAVLLGHEVSDLAQELICHGADTVHLADAPILEPYRTEVYTSVLADLVQAGKPEILMLGATDMGRDLAPRLAQRLGTGLIPNCTDLSLDESQRQLLGTHPLYAGRLLVTEAVPDHRPQMVTVRPGAFLPPFRDEYRTGDVREVPVTLEEAEIRTRVRGLLDRVRQEVPLRQATVIVSGGRGMGDPESFALLQELAEVLGGQVAGSRGAVEEGFVDEERQVGMTGQWVRPDLYVACGISGTLQHYWGLRDVRYVVAINQDAEAPIFEVADVGIVGDVKEVLPALIRELKRNRGA